MTTEDTKARHAPGNLERTESTDGPPERVGEREAEVNAALEDLDGSRSLAVQIVVDEVRRLRGELDSSDKRGDVIFARGYREGRKEALAEFHAKHIDVNEEMRAKLARVEALPAQLRKLDLEPITEHLCAQAIEAALNASVEAEADEGA
jgi:hypothetical protein